MTCDPTYPNINVETITRYADQYRAGDPMGLTNLLTLFDANMKSLNQHRTLATTYLTRMAELHKLIGLSAQSASAATSSPPKAAIVSTGSVPKADPAKPKPKTNAAIDIDL